MTDHLKSPVLTRLLGNIFSYPYASEGKDKDGIFAPARKYKKSTAVKKPILQINGPRKITYLCFDIDRAYGGIAWQDANLPLPNIVVINPENLHAHLVYELAKPVWLRKKDDDRPGEASPIRYMKAVRMAMGRDLGSDPSYNMFMVKNPFHPSWDIRIGPEQPYSLAELSEHLDLTEMSGARLEQNFFGRNCTLFDSVRYWAYSHVGDSTDLESFKKAVYYEAEKLNSSFPAPLQPLPEKEIRDIVKSVSGWIWTRYTGSGNIKRRRIMGLDRNQSLRERQQQGQLYSARIRNESTISKIRHAVSILLSQGANINKSTIASTSKLARSTVRDNWKVVVETLAQSQSGEDNHIAMAGDPDRHSAATPTRESDEPMRRTDRFCPVVPSSGPVVTVDA
jgi:Replicase family/Primase C terminal 1 (PriCT-1)